MTFQYLSKPNIDKSLKFALVCIVILSLMMSWVYIPQAEAVVAPALVIGAGVGSEVIGSVIATLVMAVTGVCFDNGFFGDTDNLSTVAYEQGYQLVCEMMLTGGTPATWLEGVIDAFALAGGFKAGDKIEVPAEVLEYTRNWVNENYSLADGDFVVSESGISLDNGQFIKFSDCYTGTYATSLDGYTLGTLFYPNSIVYYSEELPADTILNNLSSYVIPVFSYNGYNLYMFALSLAKHNETDISKCDCHYRGIDSNGTINYSGNSSYGERAFALSYQNGHIYLQCVYFDQNKYSREYKWSVDESFVNSASSSISGSDALSVPQTEAITITVPDVSMSDIGGYSVPAVQQLTGDMVIDKSTSDTEEVVPDVGGIDTEPSFTVPDTWSGIDAWFKAQGMKLTNIFTEVRDFVKAFPQTLNDTLVGVLEGVLEAVNEPVQKIKDKFNEAKNKLLPFIKNGFGFPSIWHYVVAWVGTLGAWLTTMFTVWNGLPYAMVLPVYATAVVVIVIGIYRRFFM